MSMFYPFGYDGDSRVSVRIIQEAVGQVVQVVDEKGVQWTGTLSQEYGGGHYLLKDVTAPEESDRKMLKAYKLKITQKTENGESVVTIGHTEEISTVSIPLDGATSDGGFLATIRNENGEVFKGKLKPNVESSPEMEDVTITLPNGQVDYMDYVRCRSQTVRDMALIAVAGLEEPFSLRDRKKKIEKDQLREMLTESIGSLVTATFESGDELRGTLVAVNCLMSCHFDNVEFKYKNGTVEQHDRLFISGSLIRSFVLTKENGTNVTIGKMPSIIESVHLTHDNLDEAEKNFVVLTNKTGDKFEGELMETFDDKYCQMHNCVAKYKDGTTEQLDVLFIKQFFIRDFVWLNLPNNQKTFETKGREYEEYGYRLIKYNELKEKIGKETEFDVQLDSGIKYRGTLMEVRKNRDCYVQNVTYILENGECGFLKHLFLVEPIKVCRKEECLWFKENLFKSKLVSTEIIDAAVGRNVTIRYESGKEESGILEKHTFGIYYNLKGTKPEEVSEKSLFKIPKETENGEVIVKIGVLYDIRSISIPFDSKTSDGGCNVTIRDKKGDEYKGKILEPAGRELEMENVEVLLADGTIDRLDYVQIADSMFSWELLERTGISIFEETREHILTNKKGKLFDLVNEAVGNFVTVKCGSEGEFRGKLMATNGNVDCHLEEVEVKYENGAVQKHERIFVCGSSVRNFVLPYSSSNGPTSVNIGKLQDYDETRSVHVSHKNLDEAEKNFVIAYNRCGDKFEGELVDSSDDRNFEMHNCVAKYIDGTTQQLDIMFLDRHFIGKFVWPNMPSNQKTVNNEEDDYSPIVRKLIGQPTKFHLYDNKTVRYDGTVVKVNEWRRYCLLKHVTYSSRTEHGFVRYVFLSGARKTDERSIPKLLEKEMEEQEEEAKKLKIEDNKA